MPAYDYRCKDCGNRFTLFYKSYNDYDTAQPSCPQCHSERLSRLISSIKVQNPSRDYTGMSSNEMLNVLESGDSRQVGEMFQQIGGGDPRLGVDYHDATKKLLDGESKDKVEKDLQSKSNTNPSSPSNTSTS